MKKLFLVFACAVLLLTSCSKNYDFSSLDGAEMDGEIMLSLASASYTLPDLLKQFNVDTLFSFDEGGGMHFLFDYELENVVDGKDILCFKDMNVGKEFSIPNPFPVVLPEPIDTTLVFTQTVTLSSEHISVLMAEIRSGRFDFEISSNIPGINQLVISIPEIKDAYGNDLYLDYNLWSGQNSLNLAGLHYETDEKNTIHLVYEVSIRGQDFSMPELTFESSLNVTDFHVREMSGWVENYNSNSVLDTTFKLFSNKILGTAEAKAIKVRLSERNGFQLDARIRIDTALVWGESVCPYNVFSEMPVVFDIPSSTDYKEVFCEMVHGKLNMTSNNIYASGAFALNPNGMTDIVTVSDTSTIDVKVDVDIPCSFNVDYVICADTVEMNFDNVSLPEILDEISLDFDFLTDLPFNMRVSAYMFDSVHYVVLDTLVINQELKGSFDGSHVETEFIVKAEDESVDRILKSSHIILTFTLDTASQDAMLNERQNLYFNVKAAVKYNGNVEFSKSSGNE